MANRKNKQTVIVTEKDGVEVSEVVNTPEPEAGAVADTGIGKVVDSDEAPEEEAEAAAAEGEEKPKRRGRTGPRGPRKPKEVTFEQALAALASLGDVTITVGTKQLPFEVIPPKIGFFIDSSVEDTSSVGATMAEAAATFTKYVDSALRDKLGVMRGDENTRIKDMRPYERAVDILNGAP